MWWGVLFLLLHFGENVAQLNDESDNDNIADFNDYDEESDFAQPENIHHRARRKQSTTDVLTPKSMDSNDIEESTIKVTRSTKMTITRSTYFDQNEPTNTATKSGLNDDRRKRLKDEMQNLDATDDKDVDVKNFLRKFVADNKKIGQIGTSMRKSKPKSTTTATGKVASIAAKHSSHHDKTKSYLEDLGNIMKDVLQKIDVAEDKDNDVKNVLKILIESKKNKLGQIAKTKQNTMPTSKTMATRDTSANSAKKSTFIDKFDTDFDDYSATQRTEEFQNIDQKEHKDLKDVIRKFIESKRRKMDYVATKHQGRNSATTGTKKPSTNKQHDKTDSESHKSDFRKVYKVTWKISKDHTATDFHTRTTQSNPDTSVSTEDGTKSTIKIIDTSVSTEERTKSTIKVIDTSVSTEEGTKSTTKVFDTSVSTGEGTKSTIKVINWVAEPDEMPDYSLSQQRKNIAHEDLSLVNTMATLKESTLPTVFTETTTTKPSTETTTESIGTEDKSTESIFTFPQATINMSITRAIVRMSSMTTHITRPTINYDDKKIDVPRLIELLDQVIYDESNRFNLTKKFNETLQKFNIPTCATFPPITTTTEQPTTYNFNEAKVVAKCFVCGLDVERVPFSSACADAFAGDFIPLVPVDSKARGQIANYRKYCRYLDVNRVITTEDEPHSVFGRFTGGCAVRWTDITSIYTQRVCRNRRRAVLGKHFGSKRMAKLEMALSDVDNGCIISPMATLLPLSRGISMYARFHACVCTGSWCNKAIVTKNWMTNNIFMFMVVYYVNKID